MDKQIMCYQNIDDVGEHLFYIYSVDTTITDRVVLNIDDIEYV